MVFLIEQLVAIRTGERESLKWLQCSNKARAYIVLAVLSVPLVKTNERVVVSTLACVFRVVHCTIASVRSTEHHTWSCGTCICKEVTNLLLSRLHVAYISANLHGNVKPRGNVGIHIKTYGILLHTGILHYTRIVSIAKRTIHTQLVATAAKRYYMVGCGGCAESFVYPVGIRILKRVAVVAPSVNHAAFGTCWLERKSQARVLVTLVNEFHVVGIV